MISTSANTHIVPCLLEYITGMHKVQQDFCEECFFPKNRVFYGRTAQNPGGLCAEFGYFIRERALSGGLF